MKSLYANDKYYLICIHVLVKIQLANKRLYYIHYTFRKYFSYKHIAVVNQYIWIFRLFVRLCYFSSRHPQCRNQFRSQDSWKATAAGCRGQRRWRWPGSASRKPQTAVRRTRERRGYSLIDRWMFALCEWLNSMSVYQRPSDVVALRWFYSAEEKKRNLKHFQSKSNLTGLSCKKIGM